MNKESLHNLKLFLARYCAQCLISRVWFCPTVPGGEGVPGAEVLHSGEGLRDVQEPHEHHHRAAGGGGAGEGHGR